MHGADAAIPKGGHTRYAVYAVMLAQVMRDYNNFDFRTVQSYEIRFMYNMMRAELRETTKPRK